MKDPISVEKLAGAAASEGDDDAVPVCEAAPGLARSIGVAVAAGLRGAAGFAAAARALALRAGAERFLALRAVFLAVALRADFLAAPLFAVDLRPILRPILRPVLRAALRAVDLRAPTFLLALLAFFAVFAAAPLRPAAFFLPRAFFDFVAFAMIVPPLLRHAVKNQPPDALPMTTDPRRDCAA